MRSAQTHPRPCALANTCTAYWAYTVRDPLVFLAVRSLYSPSVFLNPPHRLFVLFWFEFVLCDMYIAYQRLIKNNLAMVHIVLQRVYPAKRL